MTDSYEDENADHTCEMVQYGPAKASFWFFPAMVWNLLANLGRGWCQFCDDMSKTLYQHGLYKQGRKVNQDVVASFREELRAL